MEEIRTEVMELLGADISGHSVDHVDRVTATAMWFARDESSRAPVDAELVELAALLHDVDDYKLFGVESARNLTNANEILKRHSIDTELAHKALGIIGTMGYNKHLEGIRPDTLEGAIVSDADMCDAIGVRGLIRVFEYNQSKGRPFFNPVIAPVDTTMSADAYRAGSNEHAVQHFFDKLLIIPSIMMTEAGRVEGARRSKIMEDFLRNLFIEEGSAEWLEHLDAFLEARK